MTVSGLKPEWRAELERLGVEGVRLVLLQQGRNATVQLWPQVADSPRRSDVEDWLEAQLDEQDRRDTSVARWTTGGAAILATALSLAGVAIGLLAWLHPS
jgi:hypothetical protein